MATYSITASVDIALTVQATLAYSQQSALITFVGSDLDTSNNQTPPVQLSFAGISYQANDFAIITALGDATTATPGTISINTATGWTELDQHYETTGNRRRTAVFYKKLTSSETDPGISYTFDTEQLAASMHVFRNVDTVDPWASATPFFQRAVGINTINPTNPAITTDADNACILLYHAWTDLSTVSAGGAPSGYTLGDGDLSSQRYNYAAYLLNSGAAGVKSPGAWTHTGGNGTEDYTVYTLALKPGAAPGTDVSAGISNLTLTDNNATVKVDNGYLPNTQSLALTSYNVDVNVAVGVNSGVSNLTLTNLNPEITYDLNITPQVDNLLISTFNPNINVGVGFEASSVSQTLTANNVSINEQINVSANIDQLTLTAFVQSVSINGDVSIAPGTQGLSLTAYNVDVKEDITITPTTVNQTLTKYNVDLNFYNPVNAAFDSLVLTSYNPDITAPIAVNATSQSLSLVEHNPRIDVNVFGATDSGREIEETYYAQWEALRLAICKYYNIDEKDIN